MFLLFFYFFFAHGNSPPSFFLVPYPILVVGYIKGNSSPSKKKNLSALLLCYIFPSPVARSNPHTLLRGGRSAVRVKIPMLVLLMVLLRFPWNLPSRMPPPPAPRFLKQLSSILSKKSVASKLSEF